MARNNFYNCWSKSHWNRKLILIVVYLSIVAFLTQHKYQFEFDGGEYAYAIEHGKILHPPGHPFYAYTARAIYLIFNPIGLNGDNIIYLMAFIPAIISTFLIYRIVRKFCDIVNLDIGTSEINYLAVFLFITAPLFPLYFTWSKIYQFSVFLALLSFYLFMKWLERNVFYDKYLIFSAIVFGASVGASEPTIFYIMFFITLILFFKRQYIKSLILFLIIFGITVAVIYLPIIVYSGSSYNGVKYVINSLLPSSKVHWNTELSLITIIKRLIVLLFFYGTASFLSILVIFDLFHNSELRKIIPFILPIPFYAVFLWTGGHYIEQLYTVTPLLSLVGGFYLIKKDKKLFYIIIFVSLLIGFFTAYWLNWAFSLKDEIIGSTIDLIKKNCPVDSIVISRNIYPQLVYYMKDYEIYNIEKYNDSFNIYTMSDKGGILPYSEKFNIVEYTKTYNERIFILDDALKSAQGIEKGFDIVEIDSVAIEGGDSILWKFFKERPVSWVDKVVLYELKQK